jgi:hypothetical protein
LLIVSKGITAVSALQALRASVIITNMRPDNSILGFIFISLADKRAKSIFVDNNTSDSILCKCATYE